MDGSSTLSSRRTKLTNNIVAVEISASPYATEFLTESPVYTWVDLISNIGGQTSEYEQNNRALFSFVLFQVYGSELV